MGCDDGKQQQHKHTSVSSGSGSDASSDAAVAALGAAKENAARGLQLDALVAHDVQGDQSPCHTATAAAAAVAAVPKCSITYY